TRACARPPPGSPPPPPPQPGAPAPPPVSSTSLVCCSNSLTACSSAGRRSVDSRDPAASPPSGRGAGVLRWGVRLRLVVRRVRSVLEEPIHRLRIPEVADSSMPPNGTKVLRKWAGGSSSRRHDLRVELRWRGVLARAAIYRGVRRAARTMTRHPALRPRHRDPPVPGSSTNHRGR